MLNRPKAEALLPVNLHLPADSSTVSVQLPLTDPIGYREIFATVSDGAKTITRSIDLGIVWPPYPGVRPDSFFASNVPPQEGEKLQLLENIGLKVQRTHFAPNVATNSTDWPKEFPAGEAVPLDFDSTDAAWKEIRAHGLWVLPIAGNALLGAGVFDRTPLAEQLSMYGPPSDNERFIKTWETILRHYPEITTFEFWNEPWIFGWTWAGTPDAYRQLQRDWCKMALSINPHYRLLAGNSVAFVRDEIEPFPDCWEGLLDGSNQPSVRRWCSRRRISVAVTYSVPSTKPGLLRAISDYHTLISPREALRTKSSPFDPAPYDNNENAQKLVQYYTFTELAGLFMGNAQSDIGYGPDWTRSNTAFAVLTHFLEDRVPLVDIWPRQELLWGGDLRQSQVRHRRNRVIATGLRT